MTALAAAGICVDRAGRRVLHDVAVTVDYGSVTAIIGPNGAGKSTLLGVLAGDIAPAQGTVLLDGRPLRSCSRLALARARAVLPQQTAVSFPFRVAEVVAMGRAPWAGTPRSADDDAAVAAALAATETSGLYDRPVTRLSGGEHARVALARVLAQDTPVVLLDEPTASLDLRHQATVLREARRLADAGRAVVLVLHDLTAAARVADELVLLDQGRVVVTGRPADVLDTATLSHVYHHRVDLVRYDGDRVVIVAAG